MGRFLALFLFVLFGSENGHCLPSIPLDSGLSNLTSFLSGPIADAVVKTFGSVFDHRPMEPATPLGTSLGLDVGIEAGLVQVPKDLSNAFVAQGMSSLSIPILPTVKMINLHKGLSKVVDVGFSALSYQAYMIWAAELKLVIYRPEEGLTWALRISRNSVHVPVGSVSQTLPFIGTVSANINLDIETWTPQLVLSRQLEFADPYFGFGFQYSRGALSLTTTPSIEIPGVGSVNGSGWSMEAFLGVSLKVPVIGFRFTLEGAYSPQGFNSIGTKVGFSF